MRETTTRTARRRTSAEHRASTRSPVSMGTPDEGPPPSIDQGGSVASRRSPRLLARRQERFTRRTTVGEPEPLPRARERRTPRCHGGDQSHGLRVHWRAAPGRAYRERPRELSRGGRRDGGPPSAKRQVENPCATTRTMAERTRRPRVTSAFRPGSSSSSACARQRGSAAISRAAPRPVETRPGPEDPRSCLARRGAHAIERRSERRPTPPQNPRG